MSSSVIFNSSADIGGCRFEISIDKGFFDPGGNSAMLHNHADYEVHVIGQGSYSFDINSRRFLLDEGSVCVISPNSYHNTAVPAKDHSRKYCFRFNHSYLDKEGRILSDAISGIGSCLVLHGCTHVIRLADEIYYEYKRKQFDYHNCMDHLIYLIMLYIQRRIIDRDSKEGTDDPHLISENRTSAIDEFFAANYMNDVHSYDLAAYMNLSIRQLDRVLRRHYEMTFKQKLTEIRIFAAKRLLLETKIPVTQISQRAGYNSVEHFSAAFGQNTGHTPSAFRKLHSTDICDP